MADETGVNFMEKTISIRNTEITFSIWDLGGQREFVNMLPLVCNDAVAILFMFDLTRKSTLNSIKEWYRQGRGFNKTAIPFLIGTKYDHFVNFPPQDQEEISNQVRSFPYSINSNTDNRRLVDSPRQCVPVSSSVVQATASMYRRYDPSPFALQAVCSCPSDLQDCALESIRSQVHHPRDREHRGAVTHLSVGSLDERRA